MNARIRGGAIVENYIFFAVAMTPLAAIAIRMALGAYGPDRSTKNHHLPSARIPSRGAV